MMRMTLIHLHCVFQAARRMMKMILIYRYCYCLSQRSFSLGHKKRKTSLKCHYYVLNVVRRKMKMNPTFHLIAYQREYKMPKKNLVSHCRTSFPNSSHLVLTGHRSWKMNRKVDCSLECSGFSSQDYKRMRMNPKHWHVYHH